MNYVFAFVRGRSLHTAVIAFQIALFLQEISGAPSWDARALVGYCHARIWYGIRALFFRVISKMRVFIEGMKESFVDVSERLVDIVIMEI